MDMSSPKGLEITDQSKNVQNKVFSPKNNSPNHANPAIRRLSKDLLIESLDQLNKTPTKPRSSNLSKKSNDSVPFEGGLRQVTEQADENDSSSSNSEKSYREIKEQKSNKKSFRLVSEFKKNDSHSQDSSKSSKNSDD